MLIRARSCAGPDGSVAWLTYQLAWLSTTGVQIVVDSAERNPISGPDEDTTAMVWHEVMLYGQASRVTSRSAFSMELSSKKATNF
jgi:hypothetical protein